MSMILQKSWTSFYKANFPITKSQRATLIRRTLSAKSACAPDDHALSHAHDPGHVPGAMEVGHAC